MEAADEAMAVNAPFEKTTRRAIRRSRGQGSADPIFKITKKPLLEVDLNRSPSPNLTYLVQKPSPTTEAIFARLQKLESSVEELKGKVEEQKGKIGKLESTVEEQKCKISEHEDTIMKMKVRLELMDLQNFDLYIEKIGAKRTVVAYGILEYVHHNYLSDFARKVMMEKSKSLSTNERNTERALKKASIVKVSMSAQSSEPRETWKVIDSHVHVWAPPEQAQASPYFAGQEPTIPGSAETLLQMYPDKFIGCCLANPADGGEGVSEMERLVTKVIR